MLIDASQPFNSFPLVIEENSAIECVP